MVVEGGVDLMRSYNTIPLRLVTTVGSQRYPGGRGYFMILVLLSLVAAAAAAAATRSAYDHVNPCVSFPPYYSPIHKNVYHTA